MRPAIAIIDDCQRVALQAADWSAVLRQAGVLVFTQPWRHEDDLVQALAPFDMVGRGRLGARIARYVGGFEMDVGPLPARLPLRTLPNVVLTPHLGCIVADSMERFYRESVVNAQALPGRRPGAPA